MGTKEIMVILKNCIEKNLEDFQIISESFGEYARDITITDGWSTYQISVVKKK